MKKHKITKAVAVALIFIILFASAGTIYAYSYIGFVTSPKGQVLNAFNNSSEEISNIFDKYFNDFSKIINDKTQFSGFFDFTKAQANETDYIKKGYNYITYDLTTDGKERTTVGTLNSNNDVSISFTADENDLYSYNTLWKISQMFDADTMLEYTDIAYKMTTYVKNNMKNFLDKCEYEKIQNDNLSENRNNSDIQTANEETELYLMKVSKEALIDTMQKVLDDIYADRDLSSYTTLFATYSKNSKNDIMEKFKSSIRNYNDIQIYIYIGRNSEIKRLKTQFDTDFAKISFDIEKENAVIKMDLYDSDDLWVKTIDFLNMQDKKNIFDKLVFSTDLVLKNNEITVNSLNINASVDNNYIKTECSGECTIN